jgi:hypothetical protein
MNPFPICRRVWIAVIAGVGLFWAQGALADSTLISTTNFAYNNGQSQSYKVPSGANYVTVQAWGSVGYVCASYCATPGSTYSIQLTSGSGGNTTVQTQNGTIQIVGGQGTCSAGGSAFNVTTNANYTNGSGPASPGAGKSYPGYAIISASYATYTLSIAASPSSAGTVTGAGTYAVGATVSIKESPWNGYSAAGWGGPNGLSVASPGSASSSILMTGNLALVANFAPLDPVFTSSGAAQTLVAGHPLSFQVTATQSPIFTATNLPPGLAISSAGLITGTPTAAGIFSTVVTASNNAVSVEEDGVAANEIVTISSSTLGKNLSVYSGALDIGVNGSIFDGFCIDPWHSSAEDQWLNYAFEALASGPKMADGMGLTTALQIEQLWDEYFSLTMSNATAAGLQIAIWDLVSASIGAQTNGADWFTLNSSNNYGASSMISWVDANPNAAAANLYAVTGNGQDYVVSASSLPQPIAAAATATQIIPFMVYAQPAVTGGSASIPINQPYGYSISATASPTSYAATGLPPGLSINATSGLISGTPTTKGAYTVTLTASNPGASGTGTLTLNVLQTYTLTITSSPGFTAGTAAGSGTYMAGATAQIQEAAASGFATTGWSGPDAGSVSSPGSASASIAMTANRTLVADFAPIAPILSGGPPQIMLVGQAISAQVTATPASVITMTNLPSGLTWTQSGSIGSAPTQTGNYLATISANNNGATASETAPVAVYPQPVLPTASVTIPQNVPFSYAVGAPGFGTTLATGSLPAGFSINTATGVITGTPTAAGTFTIGLNEQNPAASASGSLTLTVTPTYTLTIDSAAGGTTTGAGVYAAGATVTIGETAASDYRAAGWGGPDAGSLANASGVSTTIVMNGNYTVSPQFIQQGTLTIAGANGGTATGGGTFDVGSVQPIAATPNASWQFGGWTGSAIADAANASTTITITGNETITPSFTALPSATITAPATAYSLSPLTVQSAATAPADNLTLHSIEWMSPDGTWTVSATAASGSSDNRTFGITFPTAGVWTVRAGASTDGGVTWYYSQNQQITVANGITTYVLESMAVPSASMTNWYNPSSVAQETYQVQHVNP